MKRANSQYVVLANGAEGPVTKTEPIILHYIQGQEGQRVKIGLPRFVENIFHIPHRILDLLEIASYVFATDRLIYRGPKDAVEYHRWSRKIEFHIRVRDYDFWNQDNVRNALRDVLLFMTGDEKISFQFEPGHATPPTNLFDSPAFSENLCLKGVQVCLFSGGIDSLSGAVELLANSNCKLSYLE